MLCCTACVTGTYFKPIDKVVPQPFYEKQVEKVAVLVKNGTILQKRQIECGALMALLSHGYSVASRADLKTLVREIEFQNTDLTDSDSAKLGKMLNVPAVLVFGFQKKGKEYTINAKLIDVETVDTLYMARGSDDNLEKLAFSLSFDIPPCYYAVSKINDNGQYRDVEKSDWGRIVAVKNLTMNFHKYKKVAIIVDSKHEEFRDNIESLFTMEFLRARITVPSRSDLALITKEIDFQNTSGLSDQDSVKLGKMLNVKTVLVVSAKEYTRRRCEYQHQKGQCRDVGLMAKAIVVETGEIIAVGGEQENNLEKLLYDTYLEKMAKSLGSKMAEYFR